MSRRRSGADRVRYALWKGDKCLGVGTAQELADKLCVEVKTIYWYASTSCAKRNRGNRTTAERIRTWI